MADRWEMSDVLAHYARHPELRSDAKTGSLAAQPRGEGKERPHAQEAEKQLLERIRRLAKEHSWLCYHSHDSRKSEPGFPDIVLTDGESLIFCECKAEYGKLTREQMQWLSLLQHTGTCEAVIWRPSDWPQIVERLTRRKAP